MNAVLHSLDAARLDRAFSRAMSKAKALGYCHVVQVTIAQQVSDLMRDGLKEDDAMQKIVKPKPAPHFDPPTRPAA